MIIQTCLSVISGLLGRLGGRAKDGSWYDCITHSKARDVGCNLVVLIVWWLHAGFFLNLWWVYLLVFLLQLGAFSTYWDFIFSYDNYGVAGTMVGLALFPLAVWGNLMLLWLFIRAILIGGVWWALHKYLPNKVLLWRRDIAEEFLRYASLVIFLP
jgi:hypothetical protein